MQTLPFRLRFRKTAAHHLMYAMHERPIAIFGLAGLGMLVLAIGLAIYLFILSAAGQSVSGRPLLLGVFLGLFGAVIIAIGFVSLQNVMLRNEIYKVASQNRGIAQKLEALEKAGQAKPSRPEND